ncbi:hypothetical protein CC2G_003814 [Coprinopsis cinerea AmutBmut pab1-1]|nr:hypothetical protein CC2G_003814 [Coprinopsis cinerea AmutBmut pab1-1]
MSSSPARPNRPRYVMVASATSPNNPRAAPVARPRLAVYRNTPTGSSSNTAASPPQEPPSSESDDANDDSDSTGEVDPAIGPSTATSTGTLEQWGPPPPPAGWDHGGIPSGTHPHPNHARSSNPSVTGEIVRSHPVDMANLLGHWRSALTRVNTVTAEWLRIKDTIHSLVSAMHVALRGELDGVSTNGRIPEDLFLQGYARRTLVNIPTRLPSGYRSDGYLEECSYGWENESLSTESSRQMLAILTQAAAYLRMNRRGNVRRYECEPPEKVYAYKAKLVKTRRNSAKIQLVPTTFTTPKNKRALSQSGSKSGGQRSRVEELLASAAASARAGPGNEMDWGNSGDVFIPFEVSDRDVIGKANSSNEYLREWKETKQNTYLGEIRVWEDDISVIVVVHLTGIHHLPVRFCSCHDAADNDIQLYDLTFIPHHTRKPVARSRFNFWTTIYSRTLNVPDRYRELLRCSREWRRLKELKRHGFSHLGRAPEEGEMALYCAACPQPDVNLPADWRDDPEQWKYYVTLVADGNFSLVHRKQKGDEDVWLKRGEGYLVERTRYAKHIKSTNEKKEVTLLQLVTNIEQWRIGLKLTRAATSLASVHLRALVTGHSLLVV